MNLTEKIISSHLIQGEAKEGNEIALGIDPVSYTHLDVYKRQVYGPWSYFTVDDGQIDLAQGNYLMMGTLESYEELQTYYGPSALVPVYICVEDGLRLERAIAREREQAVPKYKELCKMCIRDRPSAPAVALWLSAPASTVPGRPIRL